MSYNDILNPSHKVNEDSRERANSADHGKPVTINIPKGDSKMAKTTFNSPERV